jgi:hypothetical protein
MAIVALWSAIGRFLSSHSFATPHDACFQSVLRIRAESHLLRTATGLQRSKWHGRCLQPQIRFTLALILKLNERLGSGPSTILKAEFTAGLGPDFNNVSCARCHTTPATGGGSTTLKTRYGTVIDGVFDPLTEYDGSLVHSQRIGL